MARTQLRRTAQVRFTIAQMDYLKRRAVEIDPADPSVSEATRAIVEAARLAELERDKLSQQRAA